MASLKHIYMCKECGHVHDERRDFCDGCGAYNTLKKTKKKEVLKQSDNQNKIVFSMLESKKPSPPKMQTGIYEFDRVLNGGITKGSVILFTGPPGCGKTTLLLQVITNLAFGGKSCVYISGEQGEDNLQEYAKRLGVHKAPVKISFVSSVESIISALNELGAIDILVIDSIQAMTTRRYRSSAGSAAQIQTSARALIHFARKNKTALLLIGHVTKAKETAGPNSLQHAVDVVIHFSKKDRFRKLICGGKNRYGSSENCGYFEMTAKGLLEAPEQYCVFETESEEEFE